MGLIFIDNIYICISFGRYMYRYRYTAGVGGWVRR